MGQIQTASYTVIPSDSPKWVIIVDPEGFEVDVEIRVLNYRHDCRPQRVTVDGQEIWCSQLCCYTGCYAYEGEIANTNRILPEVLPYLQEDARALLENNGNQIFLPEDYDAEEKLYKIRCAPGEWDENENEEEEGVGKREEETPTVPANHCIFLMDNGLCATHNYFVDKNEPWVPKNQKFNICTCFPLDIRPQDKTLAFMEGIDEFTHLEVSCVSTDEDAKARLGYPQVIDAQKHVIVDRYGESWWKSLSAAAKDWRENRWSLSQIYSKKELKKLKNNN
jgi:hypothetical protein